MAAQQYDELAMNIMAILLHEPKNFKDNRLCKDMFPSPLDDVFDISMCLYREGVRPTPEAIGVFKHENAGESSKIAAQLLGRNPPLVPFGKLMAAAVAHLARLRAAAVCRRYHELVHDEGVDIHEVISQFQGDVLNIKVRDTKSELKAGSDFTTIDERIQWKQKNVGKLKGRPSGYARLDRLLDGLTPRYYIVGARPSVGKTAVLCDITSSLCVGDAHVVLYSLEMPADDLRERCLSAFSRVPLSGFRDSPYTITELDAITSAQNQMQSWKWWINDNPETSISDIEAQTMALYREIGDIAMVGLDYIQLIRTMRMKDRRLEIDEVSRRLKALGRTTSSAVVALSQLTRNEGIFKKEIGRTVDKRPELSMLKESGALEQDGDVIWFIHRDIRNEPEKAEFILAKQRGGPTEDSIPMEYRPQLTTFRDAQ